MSTTNVSDITSAVSGLRVDEPSASESMTVSINGAPPIPVSQIPASPLKDALFDADTYVDVPVMDGQATDKLRVSFGGTIEYRADDPAGQALFEKLTLGKNVDLRVSGPVVGKSGAWKIVGPGTDGEREVVTGQVKIKVEDLYQLSPEEL